MWSKLGEVYDDPGASVAAALSSLYNLRRPSEDFWSLVGFINEVEAVHSQLEELNQLDCITVRDVDMINNLLPMSIKMEWSRGYCDLESSKKLKPFAAYMAFLERERAAMIRTSEPGPLPASMPLSAHSPLLLTGNQDHYKSLPATLEYEQTCLKPAENAQCYIQRHIPSEWLWSQGL